MIEGSAAGKYIFMYVSRAEELVATGSVKTNPSLLLCAEICFMVWSNSPSRRATPRMLVMYSPSTVGSRLVH